MTKVLPCFKSHYSQCRSILTLEKAGSSKSNGPDSIIDLAKGHGISPVALVEDNMSGFLEAYTNLKDVGIPLIFGLRVTITDDLNKKDEDSLKNEHKLIVFARNTDGYRRLIKIYTKAATEGFYYQPRIDFKTLRGFWNEQDLSLAVPFYDSFIYNNVMTGSQCVPDFSLTKPVFFVESNNLPFDALITESVTKYVGSDFETVPAKSIYYAKRADFKAYQTFRCINNRTTLSRPNLEHCSSPELCLEAWKEQSDVVTA